MNESGIRPLPASSAQPVEPAPLDAGHVAATASPPATASQALSWEAAFPTHLRPIIAACLRRVASWRLPPNWSASDWREEIREIFSVAAWEAETDFDPARGVPFPCFLSRRVISRVLTRYRQEWSYGVRFHSHCSESILAGDEAEADFAAHSGTGLPEIPDTSGSDAASRDCEALAEAVAALPEPSRRLILRLFWEERTEAEVAVEFGICQSAVSLRKRAIQRLLRHRMGAQK